MFSEAHHKDNQLIRGDPRQSTYLACALLARGDVPISDMHRNVERLKRTVSLVPWNPDGFKMGLCDVAPADQKRALLCLSNNCSVAATFKVFDQRFQKLYRRKAMVHHYESFLGKDEILQVFDGARDNLAGLIEDYVRLDYQGGTGGFQGPGGSSETAPKVPFV